MPYVALEDGDEVIPPQVEDGTELHCPACSREMYVTRSHYRGGSFVSRHFTHTPNNTGGEGGNENEGESGECPGESPVHYKMKSIAFARLVEDHPDATVELEKELNGRIPDVLLTFPAPRAPYGKGIAVEAQYRNKGKDIDAVTDHYFNNSYSVAWLDEEDFTNHDVDLSGILTLWPNALPDRQGTEGYPDITRWLWQEKSPPVDIEIPIPGEYWTSFGQDGDWITVAERKLKAMGSARIGKSPDGTLVFTLGKAQWRDSESMGVRVYPADVKNLKSFADELDRVAFGDERPSYQECDSEWHELSHKWLTGAPNVTAWLKAALPSPSPSEKSDVVVSLWKKTPTGTENISMKAHPYAADNLRELARLLDRAFELEAD
jgi:hypothetical protein